MARYSLPAWRKRPLQAAAMRCGPCEDVVGLVGIDMVAQDGNTFAHGHFDIAGAEKFAGMLSEAIAQAKRKAAN